MSNHSLLTFCNCCQVSAYFSMETVNPCSLAWMLHLHWWLQKSCPASELGLNWAYRMCTSTGSLQSITDPLITGNSNLPNSSGTCWIITCRVAGELVGHKGLMSGFSFCQHCDVCLSYCLYLRVIVIAGFKRKGFRLNRFLRGFNVPRHPKGPLTTSTAQKILPVTEWKEKWKMTYELLIMHESPSK